MYLGNGNFHSCFSTDYYRISFSAADRYLEPVAVASLTFRCYRWNGTHARLLGGAELTAWSWS